MLQLIQATQRGDAKEFARILSHHPNPMMILNQRDSDGWTVTHHAAHGNSMEIVSIVLEKGGDPLIEIPRLRQSPIHLALSSKEENAQNIAALLLKRAVELNATPRANREGNHVIHIAARVGDRALVSELLKHTPQAKYRANTSGVTPLRMALSNGHRQVARDIMEASVGSPTQFDDFQSLFRSYGNKDQKYLSHSPMKIFVVGDNSTGKSTLIKSIQGESFYERFWGVAYDTPNVPNNKIGVVPADYRSKKFGKVTFHDLASGANFVHQNLLTTAEDVQHSLFIVVIDNRSDRKEMEQRLEFWLNFVQMQCSRFLTEEIIYQQANPHHQTVRPNVLIVASFGDPIQQKAFRNAPGVRLSLVLRSVSRHNRDIINQVNIVSSIALDCRRAESPPMTQLREELARTCSLLRLPVIQPHSQCYILSDVLRQLQQETASGSEDGQLPVMKLSSLAALVTEKSAETEPNVFQLLPEDSNELLDLCKMLERTGRLILIPSSHGEGNTWIVYGKEATANKLDELFVRYLNKHRNSIESVAIMTSQALEECLQPLSSFGMELLVKLLEQFSVHDSSVRGMTRLPSDPPIFFFPALLSTAQETENWDTDDESKCFGWSIVPSRNQVNRFFLPRFTKTLLLLIFQKCREEKEFEHRCLWSEGIHFQDKVSGERQLEVTVIANSRAIILSMRFQLNMEIPALHLRNTILQDIRSHRESLQPQTRVEESIIPKEGTMFPVRSPSLMRIHYAVEEVKKSIFNMSSHSLSCSLPPSGMSTPTIAVSRISGSSSSLELPSELPFFEPSLHLPKLTLTNRICLLRPDYIDSELTEHFLQNFQESVGAPHYKALVDFFRIPKLPITPASSVHSSHISIVPVGSSQSFVRSRASDSYGSQLVQLSSIHSSCTTFGRLVECLDSISICNTVEVLAKAQEAQLSDSHLTASTPTLASHPVHRGPKPLPLPQSDDPGRSSAVSGSIYPRTTISPSASFSGVDLSGVHFLDSLQVFACGPEGGVFHSKSSNVTITFPKGAVSHEQNFINIEFGVALMGPFDMADSCSEMNPVSPFIWICTDVADFMFSRPITIIIPHFISCDTQRDCESLVFMKADHRQVDDQGQFKFKECDGVSKFRSRNTKGSLSTQHCCFLCISSKVPSIAISKANYCLMMVMPRRSDLERFEVIFCVTYFLQTCMEVVSRQFPEEEFKIQKKEVKLKSSVEEDPNSEPEITISFQPVLKEGWVAANISGHWEIPASAISFWNRDIDELRLLDRHQMYPPRFVIDVNGTSAKNPSCLTVDFTGLHGKRVQFQISLSCQTRRRQRHSSAASSNTTPVHPLGRHLVDINQYLNIEVIRMTLRAKGALTDDEVEKLLDLSRREIHRSTIVETLIKYLEAKGHEGMANFKAALEETRHGTGHGAILEILNEDDFSE